MANGERWQDWVGHAIACPPEWDFGMRLLIEGDIWECKDRGSAIVFEDGIPWIDMLAKKLPYDFSYGDVIEVEVYQ